LCRAAWHDLLCAYVLSFVQPKYREVGTLSGKLLFRLCDDKANFYRVWHRRFQLMDNLLGLFGEEGVVDPPPLKKKLTAV
jgi:hypothetical protein